MEAPAHVERRDAVLGAPHDQRGGREIDEPRLEIVALGGSREPEDAPDARTLDERAPDALHPLGRHERTVEEHLLHLLAQVVGGRPVRHAAGEAALEQPRRAGEDHGADPFGKGERRGQGHVASERVAADHGAGNLERVEEVDDPSGQHVDGGLQTSRIEDRQRRRHRPARAAQLVEHVVPVMHLSHQAVQQDDRFSLAALEPPMLRFHQYAHAVPLSGR